MLGKLNTHEFAFGALTTSPHFGPARNPWSPDRVCGGSSGGSGAAVAADLAAGTLGTDTAGSIRIPACFCGVTGLRPSTGLVSERAASFPTRGRSTRSARSRGAPRTAACCSRRSRRRTGRSSTAASSGLRVGVVERALRPRRAGDRRAARGRRSTSSRSLGARVEPVDVPLLEEAGTIVQAMMLPEATQAHLGGCARGLPTTGRRARAPARRAAPALDRLRDRSAGAPLVPATSCEPVFERFDLLVHPAMPVVAAADRRRDGELARRARCPYRLALIPFNSPWSARRAAGGERAVRLRRRAPGRARARRAARSARRPSSALRPPSSARPTGTSAARRLQASASDRVTRARARGRRLLVVAVAARRPGSLRTTAATASRRRRDVPGARRRRSAGATREQLDAIAPPDDLGSTTAT